ncbi:hypothetical protein CY34DRAFT_799993, partial [Suillus luteus UH-Slu-Lm8-n1]
MSANPAVLFFACSPSRNDICRSIRGPDIRKFAAYLLRSSIVEVVRIYRRVCVCSEPVRYIGSASRSAHR